MNREPKNKMVATINKRFLAVVDDLLENSLADSEEEFCDVMKIHKVHFLLMRKGERNVTAEMVYKICEQYEVNANYIFPPFDDFIYHDGKTRRVKNNKKNVIIKMIREL